MNTKQQSRRQALQRRRELSSEERTTASTHIQNALLLKLEQRELTTTPMLIYRSMHDEVETRYVLSIYRPLMFAPVTHSHDAIQWRETEPGTRWKTGEFGVEEPIDGRTWIPNLGKAVLVCPVVGFDRAGNRLGFGMGCFDHWLAQFNEHLQIVIGLAFACQEVPNIPAEAHDVPLDMIITEREIIECRKH